MKITPLDLSIKKFSSHLSSLHPQRAHFHPDYPSQRAKTANLFTGNVKEEGSGGSGCSLLDCGNCDVVARTLSGMNVSLMLFCHNLCHPWLPEDTEH